MSALRSDWRPCRPNPNIVLRPGEEPYQRYAAVADAYIATSSRNGEWRLPLTRPDTVLRIAQPEVELGCADWLGGQHPTPSDSGLMRWDYDENARFGCLDVPQMKRYFERRLLRDLEDAGFCVHEIVNPDRVLLGVHQLVFWGGTTLRRHRISYLLL